MKSPLSQFILAGAFCIAAGAVYSAWYATVAAKSAAAAALQSAITTKTETVNRIAATRATLAGITDDERIIQGYFVPEANIVAFINSLQTHGKALGATVHVLSVSKSETSAASVFELALTIKGTFDAVMRTTGSIEYLSYNLSVSSLVLAQDAKDSWHADLKVLVGSRTADATAAQGNASAPKKNTP